MSGTSRYEDRGVSATKREVHAAVAQAGNDQGLFPGAFCQVFLDHLMGDEEFCVAMHSDGTGTKFNVAYLAYLEAVRKAVLDPRVIRELFWGVAQDSIVMNIDDLICVGALGPFMLSQTINRNKLLVGAEVLTALIEGCQRFCAKLTGLGIPCYVMGGETADVGDLVRTATVDNTIVTRMRRGDVIDASRMAPGDLIVGFSSTGQANWESEPNSGIGSNGFTNGRHDLLSPEYRRVLSTYAPEVNPDLIYRGPFILSDPLPTDQNFTVGSALLSPTRTYAPLVKQLLTAVPRSDIHGIIHCSGGGQTKIGKFGQFGNVYNKYYVFPVPPLFRMIQEASGLSWHEMYQCYNMGHRLEVVVPQMKTAEECIHISTDCGIEARIVGMVEHDSTLRAENKRRVMIKAPYLDEPLVY